MSVIRRDEPLAKLIDLAKYLAEPAWDLEGCALVGKQMYELAVAAQQQHRGAVEALRELHDASRSIQTPEAALRWQNAMNVARAIVGEQP